VSEGVAMLSVPYNVENIPHTTWMKALWMTKGDAASAKRLARILDESIFPIVEDGERLFGSRVTARILLEKGVTELLSKIEDRQLGRLPGRTHKRVHQHHFWTGIAVVDGKAREVEKERRGTWLGLCGPDQVRWTVDGVRIANEVIAERTLREAAAEGISLPNDDFDCTPRVLSTGEADGPELEAYVRGHLRYCASLPKGCAYLGVIASQGEVEKARRMPGSFAIQDEGGEWLLFRLSLARA
jgi:hypothetical protein